MTKIKKISLICAGVFILIIIVTCCILSLSPKEATLKIGNFYCQRTDDGLIIVGTDGSEGEDLIIPEKLDGIPVVEIADEAFKNCKVKNYIVYRNIRRIGKNAFDSTNGNFKIYLIGRKDSTNMVLKANWSGIGEVIYQDFSPVIDINGKPILKAPIEPIAPEKWVDTGDDNKNIGLEDKEVGSTSTGIPDDYINDKDKGKIKALNKIEVTSPPFKTKYIEGNTFSKFGMVISAHYTDGTSSVIDVYSYSADILKKGDTAITITYKEKEIERTTIQPIEVAAKTPTKLEIISPPSKTTYVEGSMFENAGMVVKVTYNNGVTQNVDAHFNMSKLTLGQTFVELSFAENGQVVKVNQSITVIKKAPQSLKVITPPNKTEYIEEQLFDKTGMVVEVTYNNGIKAIITSYTYLKNPLVPGQTFVELGCMENDEIVSCKQPITVRKKNPVSLKITSPPMKTRYVEEQAFSPIGMAVEVTYDNETTMLVTGYTYPVSELLFGTSFVEISYLENGQTVNANVPVSVIKKSPTRLEVITLPYQTAYSEGLRFKPAGMVVQVTYDNGKSTIVTGYTYNTQRLMEGETLTLSYIENNITVTTNVEITVGCQLAIYEKYQAITEIEYSYQLSQVPFDGNETFSMQAYSSYTINQTTGVISGVGTPKDASRPPAGYVDWWRISTRNNKLISHVVGYWTTNPAGWSSYSHTYYVSELESTGYSYKKGAYIADVTVKSGSLPVNGQHSDGSWYVFKQLIQD